MSNIKVSLCENIEINESGHLLFSGQDTVALAQKYGTPLYLVDEDRLRHNMRLYKKAMEKHYGAGSFPLYASKAMSYKRAYEISKEEGIGADVVSGGEFYTALKAGFDPKMIFFHGNNKTFNEIKLAMDNGIGYFVIDNYDELDSVNSYAENLGIRQKVLIRITPGIDPHTFEAVNTGKVDSKFGAAIETGQAMAITEYALSKANIDLRGFHCHIGSQVFDSAPFCDSAVIMLGFIKTIKDELGIETEYLNLGGGFGVPYVDSDPHLDLDGVISEIAEVLKRECGKLGIAIPKILHEPGRAICADTGMTLYTVGNVKEIPGFKNYVAIDGGMGDNPRFALYGSEYTAFVANKATNDRDYCCTIAGKCCESGDVIAENTMLQKPETGDIVAICTTGAYNFSMASNYNRIPRPPVVMLNGGESYVAVKRETYDDIIMNDI